MKNYMPPILILAALVLLFPAADLKAQDSVDDFFDRFSDDDNFTYVFISSHLISMFGGQAQTNADGETVEKLADKLESIRILTAKNADEAKAEVFRNFKRGLTNHGFNEMMVVREQSKRFTFMMREATENRTGEFLLIGEGDENLVISIRGDIDMNSISDLSRTFQIQGLEDLGRMDGQ